DPNAYMNTLRGEDVLWLLYQLIAYIKANITNAAALNGSLQRAGDGVWDYDGNSANGFQHTSSPPMNTALTYLVEPNNSNNVHWAPPSTSDIQNAIDQLDGPPSGLQKFVGGHPQIPDPIETVIIAEAQEIINHLNRMKCSGYLSVRASKGERKNPLVERSTNWGTASSHTIGGTNTSYYTVLTNELKQLVVANKNMISLGETGNLLTIGYGTQSSYTNNTLYNVTGSTTVDNAKLSLISGTGTNIAEYFTILDPKNDAIDDDGDNAVGTDTGNQAGDIDGPEIQVPGRININTASTGAIAALPGTNTITSMGTWSALQGNLINNIITNRPYSKIGDIRNVTGMDYFGADNVDNDGDGIIDDKEEKDLIYTTIANLITTHSNVFAVYVTARIVNSNATQTFAEKKLVAIVDRSVSPIKIRYFRWMTEW
ncbi:MAG: hypothetical protein U0586_07725, partial [Candidatus Brocadiaceae bacterium]